MEGFFVLANPVKTINYLTISNLTIYLNNRHPYWHRWSKYQNNDHYNSLRRHLN